MVGKTHNLHEKMIKKRHLLEVGYFLCVQWVIREFQKVGNHCSPECIKGCLNKFSTFHFLSESCQTFFFLSTRRVFNHSKFIPTEGVSRMKNEFFQPRWIFYDFFGSSSTENVTKLVGKKPVLSENVDITIIFHPTF